MKIPTDLSRRRWLLASAALATGIIDEALIRSATATEVDWLADATTAPENLPEGAAQLSPLLIVLRYSTFLVRYSAVQKTKHAGTHLQR